MVPKNYKKLRNFFLVPVTTYVTLNCLYKIAVYVDRRYFFKSYVRFYTILK